MPNAVHMVSMVPFENSLLPDSQASQGRLVRHCMPMPAAIKYYDLVARLEHIRVSESAGEYEPDSLANGGFGQ